MQRDSKPSFYITQPFDSDPRRKQPLKDAVQAVKEEQELEAVVAVVGGPVAQEAVAKHVLPDLVEAVWQ